MDFVHYKAEYEGGAHIQDMRLMDANLFLPHKVHFSTSNFNDNS